MLNTEITTTTTTTAVNDEKKTPNLYHMLTEAGMGAPASPMLRPTAIMDNTTYAWMQASRSKRRRHNSPLMSSLTADPALMASAGIIPSSLSSSGTSSYLTSPSTGMAMMSLASPPMTPKLMIAPLNKPTHMKNNSHAALEGRSNGYGRRNSSPLILPLDITPEERADRVWWQEMLRARSIFLEDTRGMDWENITVIELKRLLRKYGLNSTGKKTLLIERVKEAMKKLQELDVGSTSPVQEFKIDELVAAAEEKSREEESAAKATVAPSNRQQRPTNEVQPNNAP